jgi:hypothetical protein
MRPRLTAPLVALFLLLDIAPAEAVILYRTGEATANTTALSTKLAWIASVVAVPVGGHEGNYATMTYTQLLGVPVTYSIEQSTDLSNWTAASTIDQTLSINGSSAVVKSNVDMTEISPLFLRVRAT